MKAQERRELLEALKARFEKNMKRHENLDWTRVQAALEADSRKLWSLGEMERTGGEPDVVGYDTVFVYHNGAESYYAARGFRGSLRV